MDLGSLFRIAPAWRTYVNLDNAATTPPALVVERAVSAFLAGYGSVARGAGRKSALSTKLLDAARSRVLAYFGADDDYVLIAGFNTTSAINRCLTLLNVSPDDRVLVSEAEHSSNALPWRRARVETLPADAHGEYCLEALTDGLARGGGGVQYVACTGASNVSGHVTDIRAATRLAHRWGAKILVDAAQLVAHRKIDLAKMAPDERPDLIAFAGHKMYAPFGFGAVLARSDLVRPGAPDMPGGGTIILYDAEQVHWERDVSRRVSPGSPNAAGLIAVSAAMHLLESSIGFDAIEQHDAELLAHGFRVLGGRGDIVLYGGEAGDRIPVFAFNHRDVEHDLCAARLSWEHDIAVRSGHLCQFAYMRKHIAGAEQAEPGIVEAAGRGDYSRMYGMVRASCGLSTTTAELDLLGQALTEIGASAPKRDYTLGIQSGVPRPAASESELRGWVDADLAFLSEYL